MKMKMEQMDRVFLALAITLFLFPKGRAAASPLWKPHRLCACVKRRIYIESKDAIYLSVLQPLARRLLMGYRVSPDPKFFRRREGAEPHSRGQWDSAMRAVLVLAALGISDRRSHIVNL